MNEVDIAWAAGFFDGEGCIHVHIRKAREHRRGYSYQLTTTAAQITPIPLDKLKAIFGGKVYTLNSTGPNRRICYQWYLGGRSAIEFLRTVLPYLTVKHDEAMLAIQYPVIQAGETISDVVHSRRVMVAQGLALLKAERGSYDGKVL